MFKTSLWESCYERCMLNLEFTNFVLVQLGAVITLHFKGLQLYGLNTGYWNASA